MATVIKLEKLLLPYTVYLPFPDDIPFELTEDWGSTCIRFEFKGLSAGIWKRPAIHLGQLLGVKTIEDVKAHFKLGMNIEVDQIGDVLTPELFPFGAAVTINSGRAEPLFMPRPTNTYTYLLLKRPLTCLYIAPTYNIDFDWSQLRIAEE